MGPNALDIKKLLKPLRPRPAVPELRTLDRKHKDYVRRVRGAAKRTPAETYADWYNSPAREE